MGVDASYSERLLSSFKEYYKSVYKLQCSVLYSDILMIDYIPFCFDRCLKTHCLMSTPLVFKITLKQFISIHFELATD